MAPINDPFNSTNMSSPAPAPYVSATDQSPDEWSAPIILGAVFAVLAVVVGIPGAMVALQLYWVRRGRNTEAVLEGQN